MKKKHLNKKVWSVLSVSLLMLIFSGFSFDPVSHLMGFLRVNEDTRVAHAKELLGVKYIGSLAQKAEGQTNLTKFVFEKIKNQLPAHFKSQAKEISKTLLLESAKYDFDPIFVMAVIQTESGFDPLIVGPFAEIGLMQLKPDTAEWIAKKSNLPWDGNETLRDPSANIRLGLAYMNYLRGTFDKKAVRYVSAYNMGPGNVRKLVKKNVKPAVYKSKVMKNYGYFYSRFKNDMDKS